MKEKKDHWNSVKSYLPHRNILLLIGGTILVIGLIIFISKNTFQEEKSLSEITLNAIEGIDSNSVDTDGDTISDFEEKLDGTNPNKKDTDGDGITDDAEKRFGTDPKVKSEKDPVVIEKNSQFNNPDMTLTEAVSRDILAESLLNIGKEASPEEVQEMMNRIYSKNLPKEILQLKYDLSDILSADQITNKQYHVSFLAEGIHLQSEYINERLILEQYIEDLNPNTKSVAQGSIDALRKLETGLIKIKVPVEAKRNHLNYVNTLAAYLDSLQAVLDAIAADDPVKALIYYQYLNFLDDQVKANMDLLKRLYFWK